MCAAFRQRFYVMYLFNRNIDPIVEALLAERVCLCVLFADTLPFRSVASFRFGLSVVAFVTLVLLLLMFFAIPVFSKAGAAGVSTWFLWFSGHRDYHSLLFCYAQLIFEPSKLLAESKVGVSSLFIYSPQTWGQ